MFAARNIVFLPTLLAFFALLASRPTRAEALESDLFTSLTTGGIVFTGDVAVKLPPPALSGDLTQQEKAESVKRLAGKIDWSRFTRDSVTSPVSIDIESIHDARGKRIGHEIHSAFIVYASLDRLGDQDMMEQLFGRLGRSEDAGGVIMEEIPATELEQLGVPIDYDSGETFAYLELPLLNKVIVRGVVHVQRRERPGAYELIWRLEPNFAGVDKYAATWSKIERDAVGKPVESAPQPYTGWGGMMGVYEIDETRNQLLIDSHMVMREPQEWFAGSNFLRSKLPISLQENARSFRRKLAE